MYVCMYVHSYVHMYIRICTHTRMHACIRTHTHTHIQVCIHFTLAHFPFLGTHIVGTEVFPLMMRGRIFSLALAINRFVSGIACVQLPSHLDVAL